MHKLIRSDLLCTISHLVFYGRICIEEVIQKPNERTGLEMTEIQHVEDDVYMKMHGRSLINSNWFLKVLGQNLNLRNLPLMIWLQTLLMNFSLSFVGGSH